MPYLICNKCNSYYRIKKKDDLSQCHCGNDLEFYETLQEFYNIESVSKDDGIFYSVNKKKLVYLEMKMLKDQKEKEEHERSIRDLKYRIRKLKKPTTITDDEILQNNKERLLKELELLKKSQK